MERKSWTTAAVRAVTMALRAWAATEPSPEQRLGEPGHSGVAAITPPTLVTTNIESRGDGADGLKPARCLPGHKCPLCRTH